MFKSQTNTTILYFCETFYIYATASQNLIDEVFQSDLFQLIHSPFLKKYILIFEISYRVSCAFSKHFLQRSFLLMSFKKNK